MECECDDLVYDPDTAEEEQSKESDESEWRKWLRNLICPILRPCTHSVWTVEYCTDDWNTLLGPRLWKKSTESHKVFVTGGSSTFGLRYSPLVTAVHNYHGAHPISDWISYSQNFLFWTSLQLHKNSDLTIIMWIQCINYKCLNHPCYHGQRVSQDFIS